jgi:hypothetical protein
MPTYNNVFLTYDNQQSSDGVGSQLHRIYGIYCLSRLLGTKYLHSPIREVHYQGLDALQNDEKDPAFVDSFNRRFTLPSDRTATAAPTCIALASPPIGRLDRALHTGYGGRRRHLLPIRLSKFGRLVARWSKANTETVVRIAAPHTLLDRYGCGYEICESLSPFKRGRPNDTLRVALHIRRGEIMFVNSERLIDMSYYVAIARKLSSILNAEKIPFELEIHSELLQKEAAVKPGDPAFAGRIDDGLALRAEQDPFGDFAAFPGLKRFINEPAMTCLERLATADILVMSKSSFSYLAAILNVGGIVLYHPFWSYPLDNWLITKQSGDFDVGRFLAQLQRIRSARHEGAATQG